MTTRRAPTGRPATALVAADHRSIVLRQVYVDRYDELVRLARLLVQPRAAAEEVVQEAFARTYAGWDRIQNRTDVFGYVRTCVVNLSRQNMRRRSVVARHPDPRPLPTPPAEDLALERAGTEELYAALAKLPDRQRSCVVFRYYQGCSVAETAELLGISEGSVKTHAHRGCAALAKRLGTPTPPVGDGVALDVVQQRDPNKETRP